MLEMQVDCPWIALRKRVDDRGLLEYSMHVAGCCSITIVF